MRKLFIPLLFLILYGNVLVAQTASLGLPTNGAGSTNVLLSTSTTTNTHSQTISIYTAAEIIAAGGIAGNITALAWDKQGTGEYPHGNAQMYVYLKHVTNSAWGSTGPDFNIEVATATQVFGSTTYSLPTGTGWAPVNFTTPFAWNGTDNLAIFVSWYRPSAPTAAINWGRSTVAANANATRVNTSFAALIPLFVNSNRPVVQLVFGGAPACAAPTGLAATGITTTAASLNWNAVTGATGYEYALNTSPTAPASGTATTATTYSPGSLTPATTYYMHVRTNCGSSGFSAWTTVSFATLAAPCNDPGPIVISGITQVSANVGWATIAGAIGYEYAITSSATPPASGTPTTATSQVFPALSAGNTYYVHVRTQCGASNFSNWTTNSFTTTYPPCISPTPTVSNLTSTSANINWTAIAGSTGYEYEVSTSATPPANGTATITTGYNPINLTPATVYYAHVRNLCPGSQVSPWGTISFTTFAPCDTPVATVTNVSATGADIGWTPVTGASGYEYAVTTATTPPASGTATVFTSLPVGSLFAGTVYYLHVRSDCGGGNFSNWARVPFTTLVNCTAPNATINNVTETSANITWGPVTGATAYEYVVDNNATAPSGAGTVTTALLYNAPGLTPGTSYYLHIRSICAGNESSWSTTGFFTLFPSGINIISKDGISIYPNPAKDHLAITANSEINEVEVYNAVGAMVLRQEFKGNNVTIETSHLANGIYNIRLQTTGGVVNKQFLINR